MGKKKKQSKAAVISTAKPEGSELQQAFFSRKEELIRLEPPRDDRISSVIATEELLPVSAPEAE